MVEINTATLPPKLKESSPSSSQLSTTSKDSKFLRSIRWYMGMMMACCFSMVYFIAPFYILSSLILLLLYYNKVWVYIYITPMLVSAMVPPIAMPWLIRCLQPMLEYFDYSEIHEIHPINVAEEIRSNRKNYICIVQPHGVISFVGILSAVHGSVPEFVGKLPTAVADALLYTPILKHVLGIFYLISASKQSLQSTLRHKGVRGTIVLYVGGMAELFLSSPQYEKLYLLQRKGFIKLALQQGVDVVPIYLFGNTNVLSILKTGFLANISRKYGVSLTYIWGKFYLPIPRDCKMLYVSGQPLGMPHIPQPTQNDIDTWHKKYCDEVTRLFNTYKERVPEYKHKTLEIV